MAHKVDPELRAAEIYAMVQHDYATGGWFGGMTGGERIGWDKYENNWWYGNDDRLNVYKYMPRNSREWAGWLAAHMYKGD